MKVNRLLINQVTEKLAESAQFYTHYFDFQVDFESDWFIHLISKGEQLEIGLIHPDSEVVPNAVEKAPGGHYLTLVVDDVDDLFLRLNSDGVKVLQEPHDTFYGQRRLLIEEVNGVIIDVSSPIQ